VARRTIILELHLGISSRCKHGISQGTYCKEPIQKAPQSVKKFKARCRCEQATSRKDCFEFTAALSVSIYSNISYCLFSRDLGCDVVSERAASNSIRVHTHTPVL
jgi:hypothetical protein